MEILIILGGIAIIIVFAKMTSNREVSVPATGVEPRRITSDDFEIVRREASRD